MLLPVQDSLNNLRQAMQNTRIMCATMLDTKVSRDLIWSRQTAVTAAGHHWCERISGLLGIVGGHAAVTLPARLQGPEIRTGMLKDGKPVQLTAGQVSQAVTGVRGS
jgi:hypothetical protein